MRKPRVVRSRLEVPPGYHRLMWGEAVHEGGHALAAYLFDIEVSHVWLPGPLSRSGPSVHYLHLEDSYRPKASAFVSAAGAGAERARGRVRSHPSPGDLGSFAVAMSKAVPIEPYVAAAEALFRLPAIAPLLTATAEFLYHRHGAQSGYPIVQGHDLRGALPEDLSEPMRLAADVVASLPGEGSRP